MEALCKVDFSKSFTRKEVEQKLEENIKDRAVVQFLAKNIYWEQENKLNWRFNLRVLAEKYGDFVGNAVKFGVFEGETLFISGEKSHYILPQDELLIAQQFPKYQLKKIPDAGHWVQVEKPKEFSRVISEFL